MSMRFVRDPKSPCVEFRFYEELNDFLPARVRKRPFYYALPRDATVKQAIEALGVPHTEVDLILVNGGSVGFGHRLSDGDRVSVYPQFEALDITPVLRLRDRPLRRPSFVADAHLGALARYLRMLGFDTLFRNDYGDAELVSISLAERRTLLSRDRSLLMRRELNHGIFVRAVDPKAQVREVVRRVDLARMVDPFSRCTVCNGTLDAVDKAAVAHRILIDVLKAHDAFWSCLACARIYWRGSHYRRMRSFVDEIVAGSVTEP